LEVRIMADHVDTLKTLHTALIDSRIGYEEALKDSDGQGMTGLFRDMIALRTKDAGALVQHLERLGAEADTSGSYMSTVHRAVISVRAAFSTLDESILPGLIDGEERIVGYYNDAIDTASPGTVELATLIAQRANLETVIGQLASQRLRAAE
jgi:uncharacterized protein (TIGR02284 family)